MSENNEDDWEPPGTDLVGDPREDSDPDYEVGGGSPTNGDDPGGGEGGGPPSTPGDPFDDDGDDGAPVSERATAGLVGGIRASVSNFLYGFLRPIPYGWKFWQAWIKVGYKNLYKSKKGADAIGHVYRGSGQVDHVPMAWKHDDEGARYITPGGKEEYAAGAEGRETDYVGPVPTVFASEESHTIGSHVQARVAEALDLGQQYPLYTDPQLELVQIDASEVDGSSSQAVADGGQAVSRQQLNVREHGVLRDKLIDISGPEESDGMIVSGAKYWETYPQQATTEEMERQEERGRIAERDTEEMKEFIVKVMLIATALALGTIAIVYLGPHVLGEGSVSLPGV